ncbi:uncharacterized protein LOC134833144 isoform X2 [Culicoides brevitarsis]|uniref:uncharacterized protein LOC134833144 isoform X2 n=1 Tax=Culicoides brevitarsis TaxID=469753 RepID=UPI00307B99B2
MRFYHIALFVVGVSSAWADVGVNSANGVSSLPVYGMGHLGGARDSRLIQIAVIPTPEKQRAAIRGRSIADLNGFVEHQRPGATPTSRKQNYQSEPLNLNDKDLILFPDQFARLQQLGAAKDSYGNPVTPFPLSNDELKLRAGNYKVDKHGFVIPSYADGITDIHDPHLPRLKKPNSDLLPPVGSNDNIYYPGVRAQEPKTAPPTDSTAEQSSDLLQPPTLPVIPDVGSQQNPSFIEIPSDSLLPPLETNEFESRYNQPVDINIVPQEKNEPQPEVFIVPFNPAPSAQPAIKPTSATVQKYTGGFGFSNPSNTILAQAVDENNKYTGGFIVTSNQQAPTQVPQLSTSLQTPHLTTSSGNKYTGGFLTNQQAPTVPSPIPSRPAADRFTGSFGPTASLPLQTTASTGNKYTGGFGYAHVQPSQQPLVAAPTQQVTIQQGQYKQETPSQVVVQKYTGGFGGPPGLLVPFDHIHTYSRLDTEQQ